MNLIRQCNLFNKGHDGAESGVVFSGAQPRSLCEEFESSPFGQKKTRCGSKIPQMGDIFFEAGGANFDARETLKTLDHSSYTAESMAANGLQHLEI